MIHRNYISAYSLKKMNRSDGKCKLCNNIEENRCHIFLSCPMIDKIYSHFKPFLLSLYPYEITLEEKAFGIYREITNRTALRNYLTYQIRIVTFRNRNTNTTNRNIKQFLIE